ncbi:MFS general substrate transporter [Meredithblackwellia eburnea MCA 4105]
MKTQASSVETAVELPELPSQPGSLRVKDLAAESFGPTPELPVEGGTGTPNESSPPKNARLFTSQNVELSTVRKCFAFSALSIIMFITILDGSIVATSNTAQARALNGGNLTVWIASAYLLAYTAVVCIFARLSDIFGLGAALSRTMIQLITFRSLQGLASGGLVIICQIFPADLVSLRERGKYQVYQISFGIFSFSAHSVQYNHLCLIQGIFEVLAVVANAVGPVLGGAFAGAGAWRWCYYLMLPLAALAWGLSFMTLPNVQMGGSWQKYEFFVEDFEEVMWNLAHGVLGLNWGGVVYPWKSAAVLAPLILGITGFAGFLLWEGAQAKVPIVPPRIFRMQSVTPIIFSNFFTSGFSYFLVLFYIPQYLQVSKGFSALKAGTFLLILLVPITCSVFVCGLVVAKTGKYKALVVAGFGIYTVAFGLFSTLRETTSNALVGIFLVISGSALGATLQTSMVALQAAVPSTEISTVSGARIFLRSLGGVMGVAVGSTIINNAVAQVGLGETLTREIVNSPDLINVPGSLSPATVLALQAAYHKAFRTLFLICVGLAGSATLGWVFFVPPQDLDQRQKDHQKELEG